LDAKVLGVVIAIHGVSRQAGRDGDLPGKKATSLARLL